MILLFSLFFVSIQLNAQSNDDDYWRELERDVNSVYYMSGQRKVLIRDGILKRKGGRFFGWILGVKVNDKYTPDLKRFVRSNKFELSNISTYASDIEGIYPSRPRNSYVIRGNQIIITNQSKFWEAYRFVIVVFK